MCAKLKPTFLPQKAAAFIEPMECLAVSKLPNADNFVWEIKIDGYRAIAVKTDHVNLYSRTRDSFNSKFGYFVEALSPSSIVGALRLRSLRGNNNRRRNYWGMPARFMSARNEILNRGRDKVCPTISTLARLHPGALGRERQLLESPSNRMVRVSELELCAESALQLLSLCQMAGLPV